MSVPAKALKKDFTGVVEHRHTEIRKKEIVAAVRRLMLSRDEHVTVKKIADEVRFTQGAIYRHFRSKRDSLSFLADDVEIIW